MESIYQIYERLKTEPIKNRDYFTISSLPKINNHKIGISKTGQPIYFIKCENDLNTIPLDTNLEFITIKYNRQCQLINEEGLINEDNYTVICLNSDSEYLQEYFVNILFFIISKLPENALLKELKTEIEKLIILFTKLSKPAIKTIQGLWAELLIIEQSKNTDYLVKSWHVSPLDKYDFNDGIDKIEVKSTSTNKRIHNFSLDQLNSNKNSKLIIISVITLETGTGKCVYDLIKNIELKLNDKKLIYRINDLVISTLCQDFEKSFNIYFDYKFAVDSIQYYDSNDIPSINPTNVPENINNVRFDCDLSYIKAANINKTKSILHQSIL